MDATQHWERVYQNKGTHEVSWYREHLERSLALIAATGLGPEAAIIDVGGGASTLVDDLVLRGYQDVTVLDLSPSALAVARKRLAERLAESGQGAALSAVTWCAGDVLTAELGAQRFDLWHDRAVFHFLTDPGARRRYVAALRRAVKPGGHVIVASFGPDGPLQCSGLETMRYSPDALHAEFGDEFRLEHTASEDHVTPAGRTQAFIYCYCRIAAL